MTRDEWLGRVREMLDSGATDEEIAKALGQTPKGVRSKARRYGYGISTFHARRRLVAVAKTEAAQ